jgi:hypothetical protein
MQVTGRPNSLLALLGAVVLCALGWLLWRSSWAGEPASLPLPPPTHAVSGARISASGSLEPIRDNPTTPSRSLPPAESGAAKSKPEEIASPRPDGTPAILLISNFVAPDYTPLIPQSALAQLRGLDGSQRSVQTQRSESFRIEGLVRQLYTLDVEAENFVHRQQRIDLSTDSGLRPNALGELVCTDPTMLWPDNWVAIVVETLDGKPLHTLAERAQLPPGKLFVGAFQVLTSRRAPDGLESREESGENLARFVPPRGHKSWQLPGNCIGSLERREPALFWVELRLYGKSVEAQALAPGQTELLFRIDRMHLEERLAGLRLRVLELDGRTPVQGARVTLNANISALRRDEQSGAPSTSDGVRLGPSFHRRRGLFSRMDPRSAPFQPVLFASRQGP